MGLFTPISIGSMRLKNRIVMPAMETNFTSENGGVSDQLIAYYVERAKGGVGCITIENTSPHVTGLVTRKMLRLDNDEYIDGFRRLSDAIHNVGGKVIVQLNHAGRQSLSWVTGHPLVAPSPIPCPLMKETPEELSREWIEELINNFVLAAQRIQVSNCDGVEFHMAHGYLMCQFFSRYSNRRKDEYGGSLENRARFGVEIVRRTRDQLGADFPIFCKISVDELVLNGLCLEESQKISKLLEQNGSSVITASACNYASHVYNIPSYYLPEGSFVNFAEVIKSVVSIPVIAIGRIRTVHMAEDIISRGKADLVAMGRALIVDPYLVSKAFQKNYAEIRPCISCNRCIESIGPMGEKLTCAVNPEIGYEGSWLERNDGCRGKVLVIGGGPAGLEAARVSSLLGYEVVLYEQYHTLGRKILESSYPPHKAHMRELLLYYEVQMRLLGIQTHKGKRCGRSEILAEKPLFIVVASGSVPLIPFIEGVHLPHVSLSQEAVQKVNQLNGRICIIGGGAEGSELSDLFASMGKQVVLFERKAKIGIGLPSSIRFHLEERLRSNGVQIRTSSKVVRISSDSIDFQKKNGTVETIDGIDHVILATGFKPNLELLETIKASGIRYRVVGDAVKPRTFLEAIHEGAQAAREIPLILNDIVEENEVSQSRKASLQFIG